MNSGPSSRHSLCRAGVRASTGGATMGRQGRNLRGSRDHQKVNRRLVRLAAVAIATAMAAASMPRAWADVNVDGGTAPNGTSPGENGQNGTPEIEGGNASDQNVNVIGGTGGEGAAGDYDTATPGADGGEGGAAIANGAHNVIAKGGSGGLSGAPAQNMSGGMDALGGNSGDGGDATATAIGSGTVSATATGGNAGTVFMGGSAGFGGSAS